MTMTNTSEAGAVCTRSASRPFLTKGGDRIKAEFQLQSGEEVAVFANASTMMSKVKKDDRVVLYQGLRGWEFSSFDFAAQQADVPAAAPQRAQQLSPSVDRKKEIAGYIQQQTKALAYCFVQVSENTEFSELSEDCRRALATTIYIQMSKKFNM